MIESNELYHYGVLGMKWGHRRAQKRGETYTYKSHTTKKYEKKAAKAASKSKHGSLHAESKWENRAKKYGDRAKRSAKLDAKEQKQSLSVSTGKTVASRLLLNTTMTSKSYQRYRALGDSKARAMLKTYVANYPLSMVTKARYIRGKGRYAESE